jgi:hypothetical protein
VGASSRRGNPTKALQHYDDLIAPRAAGTCRW